MSAAKTKLPEYVKDGQSIFAAKIVSREPVEIPSLGTGAKLVFEGGKQATVLPTWAAQHNPQPGGYFVVYDEAGETKARYEANLDGYIKCQT